LQRSGRMKTLVVFGTVALIAAICACGSQTTQVAAPQAAAVPAPPVAGCPFARLRNVEVSVANTRGGVAVKFKAPANEVDAVRQSAVAMAEARAPFAACPCAATSEEVSHAASVAYAALEESSASGVEETPDGAVLWFVARDTSTIVPLRDAVRANVQAVRDAIRSGCIKT
jgi:hypothetical protein